MYIISEEPLQWGFFFSFPTYAFSTDVLHWAEFFNHVFMINTNSKFHKYAYSLIPIPIVIPGIVIGCGMFLLRDNGKYAAALHRTPIVIYIGIAFLIIIIGFWLYVFQTRMLQVGLTDYSIKTRGFFGHSGTMEWQFADLEGYSVETHEQKNKAVVEYLTIWKGKKKAFMLVDSYYTNYNELKAVITSKVKLKDAA